MDNSILEDVKKSLGDFLGDGFDSQILELIELSILSLSQIGCLKEITDPIDESTTWNDIILVPDNPYDTISAANAFYAIKKYIYIKTKLAFDPPVSSVTNIMKDSADELLWRIEVAYHE